MEQQFMNCKKYVIFSTAQAIHSKGIKLFFLQAFYTMMDLQRR